MPKRTYLDSGTLMAAFRGDHIFNEQAMHVLDNTDRTLLVSGAVWLEIMPKPIYEKRQQEA